MIPEKVNTPTIFDCCTPSTPALAPAAAPHTKAVNEELIKQRPTNGPIFIGPKNTKRFDLSILFATGNTQK